MEEEPLMDVLDWVIKICGTIVMMTVTLGVIAFISWVIRELWFSYVP